MDKNINNEPTIEELMDEFGNLKRKKFYIDVGDMPSDKVQKHLKRIKDEFTDAESETTNKLNSLPVFTPVRSDIIEYERSDFFTVEFELPVLHNAPKSKLMSIENNENHKEFIKLLSKSVNSFKFDYANQTIQFSIFQPTIGNINQLASEICQHGIRSINLFIGENSNMFNRSSPTTFKNITVTEHTSGLEFSLHNRITHYFCCRYESVQFN